MRRTLAVLALLAAATLAGCSHDESTSPTKIDEGAADGVAWSLVTFKNADGELCLELRGADAGAFSGGCGPWTKDPSNGLYMDGKGPGDTEFSYGPLRATVATVDATAPGQKTVSVPAKPLPSGAGAAKFFVIPFPHPSTIWTYTAKTSSGRPEPLGP